SPLEHRGLDAGRLGPLRQELAGGLGSGGLVALALAVAVGGLGVRRRRERARSAVVDELGVDVPVRPEHRQAWALRRAGDVLANAAVPLHASRSLVDHFAVAPFAAFPAFFRTYSPS